MNETLESKSVLLNLLQTRWLKNTREDKRRSFPFWGLRCVEDDLNFQ